MQKLKNMFFAYYPILIILFISAYGIFLTDKYIIKDYPGSADEYSYLLSAKIYSQGNLYVDSPTSKNLFDFFHMVDDGKYYGKYLPGWPIVLSIALKLKVPMLANLFFGVASVLITFLISRKLFSEIAAYIAAGLMALSPWIMMFSATYFSHSMAMFLIALATLMFIYAIDAENKKYYFYLMICGACIGILFNTRIFDSMLFGCLLILILFLIRFDLPKLLFNKKNKNDKTNAAIKTNLAIKINKLTHKLRNGKTGYIWEKLKKFLSDLSLLFFGFFPFFMLFILYNYLLTGNPLVSPYLYPYTLHTLTDLSILGFTNDSFAQVMVVFSSNLDMLSIMAPALIFVLLISFLVIEKSKKFAFYALASLFFVFLIAHSFYWSGGSTYMKGRYIYATSFALYALAGYGFSRIYIHYKKTGIILILFFALFSLCSASDNFYAFKAIAKSNDMIYSMVTDSIHNSSVVFFDHRIPSGIHCMSALQYTDYALKFHEANIIFSNQYYYSDSIAINTASRYLNRSVFSFECKDTITPNEVAYRLIHLPRKDYYCRLRFVGMTPSVWSSMI